MSEEQDLVTKYGSPMTFDGNFKGPLWRRRSCTDIPCLLIFIFFLVGWGFVAQYAIQNGNLNTLMAPTDSFNQKCGLDSQVLDKKYLFYFNLEKCIDPLVPITGCPTPQICVKTCPSETFVWDTMKDKLPFDQLKSRLICLTDTDHNNILNLQDAAKAIEQNRCARVYLKSSPFLNRCMWVFSKDLCDYIPSFILERNRRDLIATNETELFMPREAEFQAMALTISMSEALVTPPDNQRNAKLSEEPIIQCRKRTQLREEVIKEKMLKTNTRLAKLVGNLVAHFTNGTHDAQRVGEEIVEDIVNSWYIVLTALLCTLIVSLIFIAMMRWLASPILWTSIFGVLIGLAVGVFYSFKQYIFWRDTPTVPDHSLNLNSVVQNVIKDQNTWLYLSIFLSISWIIIFLSLLILRTRINIAIAVIKEGSKAVSSVISTVFFPIFSWILFIAVIVYAIAVGLYLGSIGKPTFRMIRQLDGNSLTGVSNENCKCNGPAINYTVGEYCDPKIFRENCYRPSASIFTSFLQQTPSPCIKTSCSFVEVKHSATVNWLIFYNVFGFLWLIAFISAFSDMVLAATFATWYWTLKKKDVPYFTLTRAFGQTVFYHLGTLAFGSLILAICQLMRLIVEYIDAKLKKYDNAVTRAILCFLRCFFWLLENFLRFLNKNAYIMCAIHGKNFCSSARDAFNLLMRNFLRVVTLGKVTDFLFFLSKLLLTALSGVATYYYLLNNPSIIQLNHIEVPTTIVVIASFLISSVFFGVYSNCVDTLFLCFLEDSERNDGTPEKPYYMSKQLMRILGKRNKFPKREGRI